MKVSHVPQVEVTFDIDANGILHVSAKDKATNKENRITIKANSGLTEAEIEKMVRDAEANADEDRKLTELVQARNNCDGLIHTAKKSLSEHGSKLPAADKESIEAAIKDAEQALKSDNKSEIESKAEALSNVVQKLGQAMYGSPEESAAHQEGNAGQGNTAHNPDLSKDEKVVDAEFTEVKDNK